MEVKVYSLSVPHGIRAGDRITYNHTTGQVTLHRQGLLERAWQKINQRKVA